MPIVEAVAIAVGPAGDGSPNAQERAKAIEQAMSEACALKQGAGVTDPEEIKAAMFEAHARVLASWGQ